MRYTAWGEVRYNSGVTPTDYTYTGQYSHTADFGLMFYNARWYDPALGRFAQADSIIPPGVQGLDRYAYVNNSPMNYTDPSGHAGCESGKRCLNPKVTAASAKSKALATRTPTPTNTPTRTPTLTNTPTRTSTPTNTPTLANTPTTTLCPIPNMTCAPTATNTPSPTSQPWKPYGQQFGENVANTAVSAVSTYGPPASDFLFGEPDGAPSFWTDLLDPVAQIKNGSSYPNYGGAIDYAITMKHFSESVANGLYNDMSEGWHNATPTQRGGMVFIGIVTFIIIVTPGLP